MSTRGRHKRRLSSGPKLTCFCSFKISAITFQVSQSAITLFCFLFLVDTLLQWYFLFFGGRVKYIQLTPTTSTPEYHHGIQRAPSHQIYSEVASTCSTYTFAISGRSKPPLGHPRSRRRGKGDHAVFARRQGRYPFGAPKGPFRRSVVRLFRIRGQYQQ